MPITVEDLNKLNNAICTIKDMRAKFAAAVAADEAAGMNTDCGMTELYWLQQAENSLSNICYLCAQS